MNTNDTEKLPTTTTSGTSHIAPPTVSKLMDSVIVAQTKNSLLSGEELLDAAQKVHDIAMEQGLEILSVDRAGERIMGAALLMSRGVQPADVTYRLDGKSVLLVAGYLSGDAVVVQRNVQARILGARRIELLYLVSHGDNEILVTGFDDVHVVRYDENLL